MEQSNDLNRNKDRKPESQKVFEQAENAGRLAGEEHHNLSGNAAERSSVNQEKTSSGNRGFEDSGQKGRRDRSQTHDQKGEAQNVNDDEGRPMEDDESIHARNKAMDGSRQNRDTSDSGNNSKIYK